MSGDNEPRVVRLANECLAWVLRWERQLRRWPRTWDQFEGTSASIVANLGEAFDSVTMPQKRKYFGYAKASAGEGLKLVDAATRNAMLPAEAGQEARRLLKNIRCDLVRLIEWTHQ